MASDVVTKRSTGVCAYMKENRTALLVAALVLPVFLSVTLLKEIILTRLLPPYTPAYHPIPLYVTYTLYPISISLLTRFVRRYNVIRCSLWTTYVSVFGTTVVLLLDYIFADARPLPYITSLLALAYVLLSLGLVGFHSNIIAFGYEQMESASPGELVTLVHLCLGLEYLGFGLAVLFPVVKTFCPLVTTVYLSLGCAATVTIVVSVVILFRNCMVIEDPRTPNPLGLVFSVVWYSNRVHSFHHSISLEVKGGTRGSAAVPFTTSEVSDVKTFFRLLPVLLPLGLLMVANVAATRTASVFSFDSSGVSKTLAAASYSVPYLTIPVAIPLYRCLAACACGHSTCATILNRVCMGVLLMMISMLTAVAAYGMHFSCVYFYMALGGVNGFSLFLVVSTVFEFMCAQSPYSMRSMMISLTYASEGLGSVIGIVLLYAILGSNPQASVLSWNTLPIVYYSASAALAVVSLATALFSARKYKARRRLDKKYEDAIADRVSILSSYTSSVEILPDEK